MASSAHCGGPLGFSLAFSHTMSLGRLPDTAARCAYAISGIMRAAIAAAPICEKKPRRVGMIPPGSEPSYRTRGGLTELLAAHGAEELAVAARLPELVEQKFHGLHRRERIQHLAQNPHAVEF